MLAHATVHRSGVRPRFSGLEGLTLPQKLTTLGTSVASFWSPLFTGSQAKLPPATITIVDQTPATCGSNQIATTDPPEYCADDGSIDLTLSFIQSNVDQPIGDAADALVVSDLYGFHVEKAIGALSDSNLTAADLSKMDSCFSGLYFWSIQSHLNATDEAAINKFIAETAPPGSQGSSNTATAADLTAAFNKGILANGQLSACLPSSSGG
jgi:predicted metalloprotease